MTTHSPPIASPTIREALEALDEANAQLSGRELCFLAFSKLKLVRLALEQAERERRDWEVIETYCVAIEKCLHIYPPETGCAWECNFSYCEERFIGKTCLEALSLAAEWVRKEMEKME